MSDMTKRPAYRPALPPEQRKSLAIHRTRCQQTDIDNLTAVKAKYGAKSNSEAVLLALAESAGIISPPENTA